VHPIRRQRREGLETIFDAMGVPDHTDHGPSHRENSAFIVLRKDLLG
jgi:hypothetical protein